MDSATLTPEQTTQYYKEQTSLTNPLSPKDWLAKQGLGGTTGLSSTNVPNIAPPAPEMPTKADIPSTITPNAFKADVSPYVKAQNDFITQQKARQAEFLAASAPTAQEQALTQQMTALNADARRAILTAEGSGDTQRFAAGESSRVAREANLQLQGLTDQLNSLVQQRGVKIDAIKTQMAFDKENFDALQNLSKLTKPDVISTKVSANGDVYSVMQDPDGTVRTVKSGNIPPDPEDTQLKWNETKNAQGGTTIWAVDSTGKIVTKVIPGTAGTYETASTTPTNTQQVITSPTGQTLEYGTPEYIIERLRQSGGNKTNPVASEREQLGKFSNVISQTANIVGSLKNTDTGPIVGYLKTLNPYNFDARAVNAQLQALVPGVARGVYGEVGVLTDTDIQNYMKTLPNLKSTKEQNEFVALMTLQNARRSYESTLLNMANSGVKVSGFVDSYKDITKRVSELENKLGVNKASQEIAPEENDIFDSIVGGTSQPTGFFSNIWKGLTGK